MIDRRLYPSAGIHGKVAHDFGRRVVSGEIPEGAFLPREAELAEQFSVSRQAVREALKVLAAKGLVQSRRRTGTRVLPRASWNLLDPDVLAWHPPTMFAPQLLADLGELRRLIEPAAAEYAATRGSPERMAAIGAALEEMRRTVDAPDSFRDADASFHAAVFAASGNEFISRLSDILAPILRASFLIKHEAGVGDGAAAIIPPHETVYLAIVARNGPKARRAMEDLLAQATREAERLALPASGKR